MQSLEIQTLGGLSNSSTIRSAYEPQSWTRTPLCVLGAVQSQNKEPWLTEVNRSFGPLNLMGPGFHPLILMKDVCVGLIKKSKPFLLKSVCFAKLQYVKFFFQYAVESQLRLHGLDVEKCMLMVQPRKVCEGYKCQNSAFLVNIGYIRVVSIGYKCVVSTRMEVLSPKFFCICCRWLCICISSYISTHVPRIFRKTYRLPLIVYSVAFHTFLTLRTNIIFVV